jgi:deoxyribodipyrimidine photolyase
MAKVNASGRDINPEGDRKADVNVVWLKRDLRISDNQALMESLKSGKTLLYYVFETFFN